VMERTKLAAVVPADLKVATILIAPSGT